VWLIPTQYTKRLFKGHKNDNRDAETIAEAVQRPTMNFVRIKTPEQMDLLALHRIRSRCQPTHRRDQPDQGLPHRSRCHGAATPGALRKALEDILTSVSVALFPRMVRLIVDLAEDWHRLDERIATVPAEIEALAEQDGPCRRLTRGQVFQQFSNLVHQLVIKPYGLTSTFYEPSRYPESVIRRLSHGHFENEAWAAYQPNCKEA
jgi:transposase